MGWIGWVRCKKFWCDFVARTFALISPDWPICTEFSAVTKRSQMHPKRTKCIKTRVWDPMGRIWCVHCEKSERDFVPRIFSLIAPVHTVLHRVSCSYETIPNAPKHYERHQNMSLGSNGVDQVRSLRKLPTQLRGTNLCINCTSLAHLALSLLS